MRNISLIGLPVLALIACGVETDPSAASTGFASGDGTTSTSTTSSDDTTDTGESTDTTETDTGESTDESTDTSDETGEPEGPQVLFMDEEAPRGIAVDATHVYWTNEKTGKIWRIETSGGDAEMLAEGGVGPYAIAVDDTHAYWSDQEGDGIWRVSKTGGDAEELTNAYDPTGIAVDDTNVYFISTIGVFKIPKGGGNDEKLANNVGTLGGIALTTTHVYWTDQDGYEDMMGDTGGNPLVGLGRVLRISKSGGSEAELVGEQDFPFRGSIPTAPASIGSTVRPGATTPKPNKIQEGPAHRRQRHGPGRHAGQAVGHRRAR